MAAAAAAVAAAAVALSAGAALPLTPSLSVVVSLIVPLTAEVTTCELMLAARCMAGLRSYTAASYLEVRSKYVQPQ